MKSKIVSQAHLNLAFPRGTKVPDRPEWIHEIKHDGYRLIVQREGSACACSPATATTGARGFR
jgi:ATP-dependent DNA ligase